MSDDLRPTNHLKKKTDHIKKENKNVRSLCLSLLRNPFLFHLYIEIPWDRGRVRRFSRNYGVQRCTLKHRTWTSLNVNPQLRCMFNFRQGFLFSKNDKYGCDFIGRTNDILLLFGVLLIVILILSSHWHYFHRSSQVFLRPRNNLGSDLQILFSKILLGYPFFKATHPILAQYFIAPHRTALNSENCTSFELQHCEYLE